MNKWMIAWVLNFGILAFCAQEVLAQKYDYDVELEAVNIEGMGGLQSFAVGTYDTYQVLVGGRLDGLHQRQPFAAFDEDGHNTQIFVVDVEGKQVWKKSVLSLSASLKEQLSSTNMQFYQDGNDLILTGGYGYSDTAGDHITFPYLTRVNLEDLCLWMIDAGESEALDGSFFEQITDSNFQVTGGRLLKLDEMFYLVGGHRFMGRYNPMGPDHGPGFEQDYTYEVRRFTVLDSEDLQVDFSEPIHDEMHLRRRDFNVLPFIQGNEKGLIAYSGVFQPTSNIPWLYPVRITADGFVAEENFTQYFNHYHSASLPIYDKNSDVMHSLFFGGIAQFYWENGMMVQDNDIPFVQTIADVQIEDNSFSEVRLDAKMPDYLGAGSELVLLPTVPMYDKDIVDGEKLTEDKQAVGYIFGGIRSTAANIFWENNGTQSEASTTIYKVYLTRKLSVEVEEKPEMYSKLLLFPNPASKVLRMSVNLVQPADIQVEIRNEAGALILTSEIEATATVAGPNFLTLQEAEIPYGMYFYRIQIGDEVVMRKVVWSE